MWAKSGWALKAGFGVVRTSIVSEGSSERSVGSQGLGCLKGIPGMMATDVEKQT